jgi:hypothetical protein
MGAECYLDACPPVPSLAMGLGIPYRPLSDNLSNSYRPPADKLE